MTKAAIYTIAFIQSNRLYIGSTNNHYRRKSQHLYLLRRDKHSNPKLQNYFNKYGEHSMLFSVVECFLDDDLEYIRKREQGYLDKYYAQEYIQSKYSDKRFDKLTLNITPEVNLMRVYWTDDRKKELIKRNEDFEWTDELRTQMSKTKQGIRFTDDHKEKTRKSMKAFFKVRKLKEQRKCIYCSSNDVIKLGTRLNKTANVLKRRLKCNNCNKGFQVNT